MTPVRLAALALLATARSAACAGAEEPVPRADRCSLAPDARLRLSYGVDCFGASEHVVAVTRAEDGSLAVGFEGATAPPGPCAEPGLPSSTASGVFDAGGCVLELELETRFCSAAGVRCEDRLIVLAESEQGLAGEVYFVDCPDSDAIVYRCSVTAERLGSEER